MIISSHGLLAREITFLLYKCIVLLFNFRRFFWFFFIFCYLNYYASSNFDLCRNQKTFRPKKNAPSGSKVGVLLCGYMRIYL